VGCARFARPTRRKTRVLQGMVLHRTALHRTALHRTVALGSCGRPLLPLGRLSVLRVGGMHRREPDIVDLLDGARYRLIPAHLDLVLEA